MCGMMNTAGRQVAHHVFLGIDGLCSSACGILIVGMTLRIFMLLAMWTSSKNHFDLYRNEWPELWILSIKNTLTFILVCTYL